MTSEGLLRTSNRPFAFITGVRDVRDGARSVVNVVAKQHAVYAIINKGILAPTTARFYSGCAISDQVSRSIVI